VVLPIFGFVLPLGEILLRFTIEWGVGQIKFGGGGRVIRRIMLIGGFAEVSDLW
jgi:hypothetical protein